MGRKQALFHGDAQRFDDIADFVGNYFTNNIKYIADVAGGQGMLSRLLKKKYNFESEVIDPRKYSLKGVSHRQTYFKSETADYYDLLIGLHPDGALPELVLASIIRPTLIVPCCNFWSPCRMGIKEMIADIQGWYKEHGIYYEVVCFPFSGPYNRGMITTRGMATIRV